MGLDMWIYKIEKMTDEDIKRVDGKTTEELDRMGYHYFNYTEVVKYGEMDSAEDLLAYGAIIKGIVKEFDEDKMKKEYKIPKTAVCGFTSYGKDRVSMEYHCKGSKKSYEVHLSYEEFNNYFYSTENELLVFKGNDVYYWRKAYDVQNMIYEMYNEETGKDIQNCGFHLMSDNIIEALENVYEVELGYLDEDEAFFYHEWY